MIFISFSKIDSISISLTIFQKLGILGFTLLCEGHTITIFSSHLGACKLFLSLLLRNLWFRSFFDPNIMKMRITREVLLSFFS